MRLLRLGKADYQQQQQPERLDGIKRDADWEARFMP